MAELGQRARVKVAAIGKIKTVAQMVALLCLLYSVSPDPQPRHDLFMRDPVFHVGDWLLAVAALLTLWSGLAYLRAAWPRSEEHTSELQSLMRISYAVFCLKKKKTKLTSTQH